MPGETYSPNMNLVLPGVGVTAGPQYATDLNASLTIIDAHTHSPGSGAQITPAGLNINADLPMAVNNLIEARSARFSAQSSPLALASDLGCVYVSGVDLYYNDSSGNQVRLTQSGAVAGTPGSIANLVSPASASYVALSSSFVFQSGATTAGNLDGASVILRNLTPSSYGMTLSPPTLSADVTVTLPAVPAATSFMSINSSGNIAASIPVAAGIGTSNLANGAVTNPILATDAVTTVKIADGAVTAAKLSFIPALTPTAFTTSGTFVVPANISELIVTGYGGGGGGGAGYVTGGGANGGGGAGGSGAAITTTTMPVTPGETLTITIGAAGSGGLNISGNGDPGLVGGNTSISGGLATITMLGGSPGTGGTTSGGGSIGVQITSLATINSVGAAGAAHGASGGAGTGSIRVVAGGAGGSVGPGTGGGGGGGGGSCVSTGGAGGTGGGTVGAGSQPATNGAAGAANSGAGGGGGGGSDGGAGGAGGNGGSGYLQISYVPLA